MFFVKAHDGAGDAPGRVFCGSNMFSLRNPAPPQVKYPPTPNHDLFCFLAGRSAVVGGTHQSPQAEQEGSPGGGGVRGESVGGQAAAGGVWSGVCFVC